MEESTPNKSVKKYRQFVVALLAVVSLGMIFVGIRLLINKPSGPPKSASQSSAPAPKANHPSKKEIEDYKVAADLPRYLYIPSLNIEKTRIMHLGVGKNNQIAVPDNIYDTGWYNQSAKPGKNDAMFIFGHISSWQANGIFYNLHKLKAGDLVTVERGDSTKYTYKVVKQKIYDADKVNMNEVLSPIVSGYPGLNLMTCTGKVKAGTSEFTERLVVFASLQ